MHKYKFVVFLIKPPNIFYFISFFQMNNINLFLTVLEPGKTAKNTLNKLPTSEHNRIRMVPQVICFCDPV